MNRLFGTDGVRAKAGTYPLDEPAVRKIGHSLATRTRERLGASPRFVIGRDTRESGEWIANAFFEGAAHGGAKCESAGVITTPGVAFITQSFSFDAGVVISASHNPYFDNGIKIFAPDGKKLDEAMESQIEADVKSPSDLTIISVGSLCTERIPEFHAAYRKHLQEKFPRLSLDGKKMVVDCANGAASGDAGALFSGFGAELVMINNSPNGRNINENCGSLHIGRLQQAVAENSADLGVAFDGDADRALFVDERGRIVDGDATMWILAKYLKQSADLRNDTVVATVMSNIGLEIALSSKGIKMLRTSVGDKYVLDKLLETGSDLGGEQSGHIIIPKISLVGDGMLTALFVLKAMYESGQALSEAAAGFERYPQILVNVKVKEKRPFDSIPNVRQAAESIERDLHGTGRLLLRYSGTENLARVMIEGQDQDSINHQANMLAEVIRAELG